VIDDRTHLTIGKRFLEAKQTGYPFVVVMGKGVLSDPPVLEIHDVYKSSSTSVEPLNLIETLLGITKQSLGT